MPAAAAGGNGGRSRPGAMAVRRDRDLYLFLMAVSVIFAARAGSAQSASISAVFLAANAALAALATQYPRFYARHRTAAAVFVRLLYAASANAAVAGSTLRQALAHPSALRFWAERSNPYVILLLGLTAGLEPGPLAGLLGAQVALLAVSLPPACAALEARHPSNPARFADATRAWTGLVGGLAATMVGDAATLVDLAAGRRGGGGAGGGRGGGPCPPRTCCLVMAQLYLTASCVSLAAAVAGGRRRRAAAAAAAAASPAPPPPPASPWAWALDRHARAAALEACGAVLATWVALLAVDRWLPCPG